MFSQIYSNFVHLSETREQITNESNARLFTYMEFHCLFLGSHFRGPQFV